MYWLASCDLPGKWRQGLICMLANPWAHFVNSPSEVICIFVILLHAEEEEEEEKEEGEEKRVEKEMVDPSIFPSVFSFSLYFSLLEMIE